ncbi:hypothetical protein O181_084065 [Austropuccinia psidii MF-1]|uniref:Uncharacterized protein n=1 Tax=Austropuccinia psidii MF-1 TaxID=1389203 RepID=A0A9Q3FPF2_9BASI|nr:hypothetical protein [Austropuccinia psidii MF-1]
MSQPISPPTNASNPNSSEESIQQVLIQLLHEQQSINTSIKTLQNDIENLKVHRAIPEANTSLFQATVETQSLPQTLVLQAGRFQRAQSELSHSPSPGRLNKQRPRPASSTLAAFNRQSQTITAQILPRRHPIQMSANEFPPNFQGVKALWRLVERDSVPDPFPPSALSNFYHCFSNTDEIQCVAEDSTAPSLIDEDDVADFVVEKAASLRLGSGIGDFSESLVLYIRGTLARLGITIWSPNIAQNCNNLYSSACRISAITTFQQVASAGSYDYMAMNHIYILDSALLQRTYDHYVHFVVKSRFD